MVAVGGLYAAVGRLSERPVLSEAALRHQHEIVVALNRSAPALLPVRFGALVDSDELSSIVGQRYGTLRRALDAVRGQDQMTIRVFDELVSHGPDPSFEPGSGADYLRRRAAAAQPRLTEEVKRILESVKPLVSAQVVDAGRGTVQATIHHLVRRGRAARYRGIVASSAAGLDPRPDFTISGPWPPFAFAPDIWSPSTPRRRRGA